MKNKTLFSEEEVRSIAEARGKHGKISPLSVNMFGKGTEIWEVQEKDKSSVLKFDYSPDSFHTLMRVKKLYNMLRPGMSEIGIEIPDTDVFRVKQFNGLPESARVFRSFTPYVTNKSSECWCSLTKKFEGERLEDIYHDLNNEERKEIYGQLGRIIGEISDIKFDSLGYLDSDMKVMQSETGWKELLEKELDMNLQVWKEHHWGEDLIDKIKRRFGSLSFPEQKPSCVVNDLNRSSIFLRKQNGKYGIFAVIDLDECFSGHPECGLSRGLSYLAHEDNPAFPNFSQEYDWLLRGYKEKRELETGFKERHLENLLLFNVTWTTHNLVRGFDKGRDLNTRAIEQLL